jgi:hypothetical protein
MNDDIRSDEIAQDNAEHAADTPTCSCFPGERPEPCERQFAYHDCWRAAVRREPQVGRDG